MSAAAVYRDDHAWLPRFAQHVSLAESLLQMFAYLPQRLRTDMEDSELADLQREARAAYEGIWENLGLARELAHARGRNITAYDRARSAAGNIWSAANVDGGDWRGGFGPLRAIGKSRQVLWTSAPIEPAVAAILAIKAAVPEVVIAPPAPQPHVDLRSYGWLRRGWPVLVVALVLILYAYLRSR